MADDKKRGQGDNSLSSHSAAANKNSSRKKAGDTANTANHIDNSNKKDALKGKYVNMQISAQKEKQKERYRQASQAQVFTAGNYAGETYTSHQTHTYSDVSERKYTSQNTEKYDNPSPAQYSHFAEGTYNSYTNSNNNEYSRSDSHYINRENTSSVTKEPRKTPLSGGDDNRKATAEKAAMIKTMLEQKTVGEKFSAVGFKDENEAPHSPDSYHQPINAKDNKSSDNKSAELSSAELSEKPPREYKKMGQEEKESYQKAIKASLYTARQKSADMYYQHLTNQTLISAEKELSAARRNYNTESVIRENAEEGMEIASEAMDALNSEDAGKLLLLPAAHILKRHINQNVIKAADRISSANNIVNSSDSVGSTVIDLAADAAANETSKLAKSIFLSSDKKLERKFNRKVKRIDRKYLNNQLKIQRNRGEAMNGNIGKELEKKLDKIEQNQEKYKEKLLKEKKTLQKKQYQSALKKKTQVGIYKQYNAAFGSKAANAALTKAGSAAVMAGASSVVAIILILVLILMFISSLFFWLDNPDKSTPKKEQELLEDYVEYISDYFDWQQIKILQKVDRFWGGFKPDKYHYQNRDPAYIESLDKYENRWLKLENFSYENVIALAAVKKFHELETKRAFSDNSEIDISTYVMSITEQDLDDVMQGMFYVYIQFGVINCDGDCTETETVTATPFQKLVTWINHKPQYETWYHVNHHFTYSCGQTHHSLSGNVINYSHYGEEFMLNLIIKPPSPEDYPNSEEYEKAKRMAENDRKVYQVYKDYIDDILGTATMMPDYESASERARLAKLCGTAEADGKYVNAETRDKHPAPNEDFMEDLRYPKEYTRVSPPLVVWSPPPAEPEEEKSK